MISTFGTAQLSGFGLSTLVDEHWSTQVGQLELETVRWTAPESFTGGNINAKRKFPTPGSDIYSFGCIMLQVSR